MMFWVFFGPTIVLLIFAIIHGICVSDTNKEYYDECVKDLSDKEYDKLEMFTEL